ncbi:MAG: translocation/assembly module TamB domain-containing protein [Myxococcota bacterium]
MVKPKHTGRYIVLTCLAILLGGILYVAGKTPEVIRVAVAEVRSNLWRNHGIRLELGKISIQGFLTVGVDGFLLEKKDIKLFIQAKSVKARLSPWQYFSEGNPVSRLEIDTPEVIATVESNSSEQPGLKLNFALSELVILNGRAEIHWKNKVFSILDLQTHARIHPKRVDIYQLSVQTPEVSLKTDGVIHLEDLKFVGLRTAMKFEISGALQKIPELRNLKIPLEGDFKLEGHIRYPSWEGGWEMEGQTLVKDIRIDDVRIHSLAGPVYVNQHQLEVRNLEASFGGAKPRVGGILYLDKQLRFVAELNGAQVSLYELLSDLNVKKSWVDLNLDVNAKIKGQILPEFSLTGQASGKADSLVVHDRKQLLLKSAYPMRFDMGLFVDKHAFKFKNASITDGKSKFDINCDLYLDHRHGMWLEGEIDRIDFSTLKNRIADGQYFGTGEGRISIDGPYEHLVIRGPVHVNDFGFDDFKFGDIRGLLEFRENILSVRYIRAKQRSLEYEGNLSLDFDAKPLRIGMNAELKKGQAEDLRKFIIPQLASFEWFGPLQGEVELRGPLAAGHFDGLMGRVALQIGPGGQLFGKQVNSGTIMLTADENKANLIALELNSEVGKAFVSGEYDKASRQGTGLLKLAETPVGRVNASLLIQNNRFLADGLIEDAKAAVHFGLDLEKTLPYEAQISVPYGPLKTLFPKIAELEDSGVQAGIRADARGELTSLASSKASIELFPAVFQLGTLRFVASRTVKVAYENKALTITPEIFKSLHGDWIEIGGVVNAQEMALEVKTEGDLWLLTHLDDRIEGAYGNFDAKIKVLGPLKNPGYFGKATISPGSYISLRDYPPGLKDLQGVINFNGTSATADLRGSADQGSFKLLGLANFHNSSFDSLRIDLQKMPIYYGNFLSGTANGYLKLEGPFKEPTLEGDIKLSDVLITKELDPTEFKGPRSRARKQAVKFDLALSAENPVRIETKSLHGELIGNVKLIGTSNAPGLLGELTMTSGEIYFRNNYYQILKARASFDNPFRIMPYIDLEANTQILDYDVTVRAQGPLNKPKLSYSSRPSLPQSDLVSLITFGFTSRDNRDNLGVARTAGLEAFSMYSGLGDQVIKALPGGAVDELRLGTLYNQNGGVTSSVVLGMQVFKGMRLRFQSALVQNSEGNREKRLELERYINRRWRWRLIWNSEGITNYGDAGADLWVRWDF